MLLDPCDLPPGAECETVSYSGKTLTIYKVPFVREGPILVTGSNGRRALVFMYAHFLFYWPEGDSRVTIAHGSLEGDKMPLPWELHIDEWWDRTTLTQHGQEWVQRHLAQFQKKRGKP